MIGTGGRNDLGPMVDLIVDQLTHHRLHDGDDGRQEQDQGHEGPTEMHGAVATFTGTAKHGYDSGPNI